MAKRIESSESSDNSLEFEENFEEDQKCLTKEDAEIDEI